MPLMEAQELAVNPSGEHVVNRLSLSWSCAGDSPRGQKLRKGRPLVCLLHLCTLTASYWPWRPRSPRTLGELVAPNMGAY